MEWITAEESARAATAAAATTVIAVIAAGELIRGTASGTSGTEDVMPANIYLGVLIPVRGPVMPVPTAGRCAVSRRRER